MMPSIIIENLPKCTSPVFEKNEYEISASLLEYYYIICCLKGLIVWGKEQTAIYVFKRLIP